MVEKEKIQKRIFRLCLLFCILSFLMLLQLGYTYEQTTTRMLEVAQDNAESQAKDASQKIGEKLGELKAVSGSISQDLSTGKLHGDQVQERIKETIEEHPELFGVAVAYQPYEYDPEKKLYAPFYVMRNGTHQLIQIEEEYDYTLPDRPVAPRTVWYHKPLTNGAGWIEPYFGTASNTLIAVYSCPFYRSNTSIEDKNPTGVTAALYSLDNVRLLVGSLELGKTGYGLIFTEKGTIVSHPIHEYLGKNIVDLGKNDETLQMMTGNVTYGKHQVIKNNFTDQNYWVIYESIPSTNWTLAASFVEEEIFYSVQENRHSLLIRIVLTAMVFMFFLIILIFRAYKGDTCSLWIAVISFSILCFIGTAFILALALEDNSDNDDQEVIILDKVGIEAGLNKLQNKLYNKSVEDLQQVPTGIFIQSMEFSSAYDVTITGYIWQKNISGDTKINPGFILPDATGIEIREIYDNLEVTVWNFRASIRQSFDYSKYPFDHEDVWVRLWHSDLNQNIILTPDLDSYNVMQPKLKPGLENDIVLEEWDIKNSYFSFRRNKYNTNFGINDRLSKNFPELYFNIGMNRDFISAFVSDLIPIVVVAILLFAVLMISTMNQDKITVYGFSSSTVLGYCAALFFVLIISHVSLRTLLASEGIIYLEYFYFVMYFILLAVSVNSIQIASSRTSRILQYEDNLIVKLLFWPIISFSILVITLVVF